MVLRVSAGRWLLPALFACLLAGCSFRAGEQADAGLLPAADAETSPLALRRLQVRDYPVDDGDAVMRAVIASLQDEGFTITSADAALGLVSATLEASASSPPNRRQRRYWFAADPRDGGNRQLSASISVLPVRGGTRVRLGFVSRAVDAGGVTAVDTVVDPGVYQEMFSRLDRAVFYELQRL